MEFIKCLKKNLTSWLITSMDRTYKESPRIQEEDFPLQSKNISYISGIIIENNLYRIFLESANKFGITPSLREIQKHCKYVKQNCGVRICGAGNIPTECKPEDCSHAKCLKKYLESLTNKNESKE